MLMSWYINAFRNADPLWGESICDRWFPSQKVSYVAGFNVSFHLNPQKMLKQSSCRWFETPCRSWGISVMSQAFLTPVECAPLVSTFSPRLQPDGVLIIRLPNNQVIFIIYKHQHKVYTSYHESYFTCHSWQMHVDRKQVTNYEFESTLSK